MFADDFAALFNGDSENIAKEGLEMAQNYRNQMPMYMHVLTAMIRDKIFVGDEEEVLDLMRKKDKQPLDALKLMANIDMAVMMRFNSILMSRDPKQQEQDALLWIEEMELEEEIDSAE